jgi:hemerythrin superfamily protein
MTQTTNTGNAEHDVVDLLMQQHERVRQLFAAVESTSGDARKDSFEELRALLAVHETAEEMVVHPSVKKQGGAGESVVEARLQEEHDAKEILSELDGMDVTDANFTEKFATLKQMVTEHAESEEREEFPLVRQINDADQLAKMAKAVQSAEKMAPTHPHPGVESQAANMAAGPMASLIDRTRDAVKSAMS